MIKVTWDADVCIHAGECVNGLPEVFKVNPDGLQIEPAAASEEAVREVVARCPSGALSIEEEG